MAAYAATRYRDAVSLPVALQRSARGATLASWQQSHGSSGSVEAVRLVICAYRPPRGPVCTPTIGRAVRHPLASPPGRVISGREG